MALNYKVRGQFPTLTLVMIDKLRASVTRKEVREALFAIIPLKAPGANDLHEAFFQHHWDIIGDSICKIVMKVFQGAKMEKGLNKTLITFIPKVTRPESIKEFRSIRLFNVSYKLIAKIIANRLKSIMPYLISITQASFVKGCVSDNIIMATKVIHSMREKKR